MLFAKSYLLSSSQLLRPNNATAKGQAGNSPVQAAVRSKTTPCGARQTAILIINARDEVLLPVIYDILLL